ncbi:MAG: DNA-directed RNA polymerase subunit alpha [Oligoflexales bacterium]|nr:DNA-directed RNA polymerase subunit alpha [Oligoflexales bacterium]
MHRNWNDLIKPKGLEAEQLGDRYGKFVAKPLERGYGMTLGNSLRRVLLSSINGAAVIAVRFEGVDHEFSTIPGVKEDVTDIILNIKQLNLRYLGDKETSITLTGQGPGALTGADIQTKGDVEVLNPDHVICTLNEEAHLHMEMLVQHGCGYVPAERNRTDQLPAGYIPIDSIFAPIRRVAYNVQNVRVGQDTDYDKLSFEVWTNGAIRPDDAVAYAAKILKDQLTVFINFDEAEEVEEKKMERLESPKLNEHLFKTVDALELSVRAANCLENANIKYIGELVTKTEGDMLKTKNFGRKSLNEIKDILVEMGLSLGMKIDGFDPSLLRQSDQDVTDKDQQV